MSNIPGFNIKSNYDLNSHLILDKTIEAAKSLNLEMYQFLSVGVSYFKCTFAAIKESLLSGQGLAPRPKPNFGVTHISKDNLIHIDP